MPASIEFTESGGILRALVSSRPGPSGHLSGFVPDAEPMGPSRPTLATGELHRWTFRTDYRATFAIPGIGPEQLETAQKLRIHLLNGGTATLRTDDAADRSYTIRLAPESVPSISGPDERYEYTFQMTALNTAASPLLCNYDHAALILRAGDELNAFARATMASYHAGPSPLSLASAASGVPRHSHYIGTRRTMLVEGAQTNHLTRSGDPSHADWTKDDVTVDAASAVTAPDGASASRLVETAVNSLHGIIQNQTITDGETIVVSGFFRAAQRFRAEIIVSGGGGSFVVAYNVNTGTKGENASGGGAIVRTYIDSSFAAFGWYRLVAVGTLPGGVTTASCSFNLNDDSGITTYTGDTSKGAYWWGMQLERNAQFASSYIPTTTASATRNGEVASIPFPFAPQPLWIYVRFIELGTILQPTGTFGRILDLGATFPNSWLAIVRNDALSYNVDYALNSANSSSGGVTGSPVLGDVVEHLVVLDANGRAQLYQSINGAAPTTTGAGNAIGFPAAWGLSTLYVGSANGAGPAFNAFDRIAIGRGSLGSGANLLMAKARGIAG